MPLYAYHCKHCNNFEDDVLVKWSDSYNCNRCGEPSERQLSAPAMSIFKGAPFSSSSKEGKTYARAEFQGRTIFEQKIDKPEEFKATKEEQAVIEKIKAANSE